MSARLPTRSSGPSSSATLVTLEVHSGQRVASTRTAQTRSGGAAMSIERWSSTGPPGTKFAGRRQGALPRATLPGLQLDLDGLPHLRRGFALKPVPAAVRPRVRLELPRGALG